MLNKTSKMKYFYLSLALGVLTASAFASSADPIMEIVAGADGYKVVGSKKAEVVVRADSTFRLLITAEKGDEWQNDGSVHSFTVKELGWDFPLKEGENILDLNAPPKPGEYLVECTIKCGDMHEDMFMILIVEP